MNTGCKGKENIFGLKKFFETKKRKRDRTLPFRGLAIKVFYFVVGSPSKGVFPSVMITLLLSDVDISINASICFN